MFLDVEIFQNIGDYISKINEYFGVVRDIIFTAFDFLPDPFNKIAFGFSAIFIAVIVIRIIRG